MKVEALLFDVFGTVADWRSSVEQELRLLTKKIQYCIPTRQLGKRICSRVATGVS